MQQKVTRTPEGCVNQLLTRFRHAAQVAYQQRDARAWAALGGFVGNAAAGKALKRLVAQPRPALRCGALGNCGSFGWPSSHAQTAAFAWALHLGCALLARRRAGPRPPGAAARQARLVLRSATVAGGARLKSIWQASLALAGAQDGQQHVAPPLHLYGCKPHKGVCLLRASPESASEPVLVPVRSCWWSSTLLRMQSPQQLQR